MRINHHALQTTSNRRVALVIVGVCALAAVGFYSFRQYNAFLSAHSTSTGMRSIEIDQQALAFLQAPQGKYVTPGGAVLPYPPSALEKMETRNRERGYFATEALLDYENYPKDTLDKEALEGNLLANLALRLKMTSDENAKIKELCELAIVYGSTEAISCMANIASAELPDDTSDVRLRSVLVAQAWYEVGVMRGDRLHERNAWEHLQDSFDRQELTGDERAVVNDAAQGIYDRLTNRRKELGLPDFDNSVPDDVNQYYDHVIRDWLKNYLNIDV